MYKNEKPAYIALSGIKSSSPPPPIGTPPTTDEGFAFSTLLRRAEDETLLRGHHHTKPLHRLPTPTNPTFHHKPHPNPHTQDGSQWTSSYASATPSAVYSVQSIDQVIQQFGTHPVKGLSSQSVPQIRGVHGPNEFEVDAKESVLKKFLAQFYESPLNLLLLGSAAISYIVGNKDDAVSITAAIVIVVTGN
jgi:Ca2+-transporting ATPase